MISEQLQQLDQLRRGYAAIAAVLDDRFEEMQPLFERIEAGDLSRLSPDEIYLLKTCLCQELTIRHIRDFEQHVLQQIQRGN